MSVRWLDEAVDDVERPRVSVRWLDEAVDDVERIVRFIGEFSRRRQWRSGAGWCALSCGWKTSP